MAALSCRLLGVVLHYSQLWPRLRFNTNVLDIFTQCPTCLFRVPDIGRQACIAGGRSCLLI
jgi:hypothetical protein